MNFEENLEDFENPDTGQNRSALLTQRIYARTSNFMAALTALPDPDAEVEIMLEKYLNLNYEFGDELKITGAKNPIEILFDSSCYESINSPELPNLMEEACKSIIVMEFFTHCCINCIHSIEDLREVHEELNETYESLSTTKSSSCGLKFVSIHSPKFTREKDSESIKAFTKRMKMNYSNVVNDPGCLLWNKLGICCWPTVLVFGPNSQGTGPNLLFTLMGEGHKDVLRRVLKMSMKYFDKRFPFEIKSVKTVMEGNSVDQIDAAASPLLKYPGKVTCHGKVLAVGDSGNNRIIVSGLGGLVKHFIGGTAKGYKDGDFESARFYNPQGIAFYDDNLIYVADTGNHAIRKIDLIAKIVTTLIAPNLIIVLGEEIVAFKSPWDLVFYSKDILLIAAAGNHRIFGYFFESQKLFNVKHPKNCFTVVAGSGHEENRNNSYVLKAGFAQPSGICVSQGVEESESMVYIADSESSSMRAISKAGKVINLVGGARDPTDLFAYGDIDGKGFDAKMQHPMGVCWSSSLSSIFVADTYNHKVKVVYLGGKDKESCTIIGDGISGNECGRFSGNPSSSNVHDDKSNFARLNEPGGICCDADSGFLYIADTNNHAIKVADLSQRIVKEFSFIIPSKNEEYQQEIQATEWDSIFNVSVNPCVKDLSIEVVISGIPKNFEGGQWNLKGDEIINECRGEVHKDYEDELGKLKFEIPSPRNNKQLKLSVDIFLCGISSCYKKNLKFLIKISDGIFKNVESVSKSPISLIYNPKHEFFGQ